MALYKKQFTKPYLSGYVDKPQKITPVTAEILNMQDNTFIALEDFLTSEDVIFKKGLTVGSRAQITVGEYSIVVGQMGAATGQASVALGKFLQANGNCSVAMGNSTLASGNYSFAAGVNSKATGNISVAIGNNAQSLGANAYAEGVSTIASGANQHVQGKYNVEDPGSKYAHIVGGGTSNTDRKNIHTIDWSGNAVFAGNVINGNGVSLDGLMELIGTTGQLRTIVETLPEENISTSTIYMILKKSGSKNDIYNEYINVDGTPEGWEFIGSSAVDLSDYYTKSQVEELLEGYVPAETGKGLSSNDYTETDKELVDSIKNMTAEDAMAILNGEVA